jgi:hypothetical protein
MSEKIIITEKNLADMLDLDSLDVKSEDDFETYEEYESWRDATSDGIYTRVHNLDGKDVDAGAFFKMKELWEPAADDASALFFTDCAFTSGAHVGCVVDTLTRSISQYHGDPVLFLMHLI